MIAQIGSKKWRALICAGLMALLLAPLVAMRFTDQVRWTPFDFAMAGALLFGAMGAYLLSARMLPKRRQRQAVGAALVGIVLLLWAHGAVGIF